MLAVVAILCVVWLVLDPERGKRLLLRLRPPRG